MIRKLDLRDTAESEALLALQRRSYRVEAELIGFDGIPPLHETLVELQASSESFYGFFAADTLAGAVALEWEGATVTISRLVVDPAHFRQGIGGQLLRHALAQAAGAERVCVSTGSLNTPAIELYRRHGFAVCGAREVAPGVFVTKLERSVQ